MFDIVTLLANCRQSGVRQEAAMSFKSLSVALVHRGSILHYWPYEVDNKDIYDTY